MANRSGDPPVILPGKSARMLGVIGARLLLVASLLLPAIALEGAFGKKWWLYGLLVVIAVSGLGVMGCVMMFRGGRKRGEEIANGYTTILSVALENPTLYAVNSKTFEIARRPEL